MKPYNCIRTTDWIPAQSGPNSQVRSKLLLNEVSGGAKEFTVLYSELEPGAKVPMHCHHHPHSDYFISGRVWAQLGCQRVELEVDSAAYFPAQMPHAYEAVGNETLRYYSIYACEKAGQEIRTMRVDPEDARKVNRPNMDESRWAVAESFEPLRCWEPSKGKKGLLWTSLFDAKRGGHKEMIVGTNFVPAGGRYSRHYHDQPEIFIGLEGTGILFCGNEEIEMAPGTAAYVGKKQVHGAQTTGPRPLKMIWAYGTETASPDWSWTPVEDITIGGHSLGNERHSEARTR